VCARGTCSVTCTPPLVASGTSCVLSEYGTGSSGAGDVTGTRDISRESISGRSTPDAPWFSITAIGGSSTTLTGAPVGLATDDEVLLINLQGAPGAISRVGTYEFLKVLSVTGSTVVFTTPVANTYGATSNASLTGQVVAMVRVPAYASVTVRASAVLTTQAFNGTIGGVLAFRVSGDLNVAATGRIDMASRGYRGGLPGAVSDQDGYQGESRPGRGCGGQVSSCTAGYLNSPCNVCWNNNDGAGGSSVTGGGGNHGGGATPGVSWNGGSANPPSAGGTYGIANLSQITLGSGGGGTWRGGAVMSLVTGPGGNGGGAIFFTALRASLVANALSVGGETCTSASAGSYDYGCGGGSGGSMYVRIQTLVATGLVASGAGGAGVVPPSPAGRIPRPGGNGGYGRIRVDVRTINGVAGGTSDANTAINASFEPDPGFIATAP
jgi:large repetitive protein